MKGAEPASGAAALLRGWKRSPVLRVGSAYLVGAWALVQVCEVVLPSYNVPPEIMPIIINTLAVLFPLVLLAARFTSLSHLVGLGDDEEAPAADAARDEVEEILRLEQAEVEFPVALSERRRVTTVACSVRGVRDGKDDPELVLGIVSGLDEEIDALVGRYEGTRLSSSRNQIAIAFGYPVAHEDDVRRAAKAAQEILTLLAAQDRDYDPDTLIVGQAGLHSDIAIIDQADRDGDDMALLGDNKTLAEWLMALAPDRGIALSAASGELLKESFQLKEIGRVSHPRLGPDAPVFQLGAEHAGALQQIVAGGQYDIIGREHQLGMLMDHWQTVMDGESRYVLLVGEPGIGKSTLLYRAVSDIVEKEGAELVALNCESYYQESPLRPVIRYLERRIFEGDLTLAPAEQVECIRAYLKTFPVEPAEFLPRMMALLSVPTDDPELRIDESSKLAREKTLRQLIELIHGAAGREPLVLVIEDIHWMDPSTRDLIDLLLRGAPEHRIFGVFTSRPEFQTDWTNLPHVFAVNLDRLPSRKTEELIRRRLGNREVSDELIKHIARESGGIPFYAEELIRGLRQADLPLDSVDLDQLTMPETLQATLSARVDRLGASKPLLQLCSAIGLEFAYPLLREVVRNDDETLLRSILAELVSEGVFYLKGSYPDITYRFQHRLLMDAAYQSLTNRTRQQLHHAIGETIEAKFPELCNTFPVLLAQHFDRAGDVERSIDYRVEAVQRSIRQFAIDEALTQLGRSFELLEKIADPKRREAIELTLQNLKGSVLLSSQGFTHPGAVEAFNRAVELSMRTEHSPELFRLLVGLWMYYLIKPDNAEAQALSERLLALAAETGGAPELLQANYCAGYSRYYVGRPRQTLEYFRRAAEYEQPGQDYTSQTPSDDDSRIHLHCMLAHASWIVGESKRARAELERTRELAAEAGQPYAVVWSLFQRAWLYHMQRDYTSMRGAADRMVALATEKGVSFFVPLGLFLQATQLEDPGERIATLVEQHETTMLIGARAGSTYFKSIIVEELIAQERLDEAAEHLGEIAAFIEEHDERLWEGEYLRLEAELRIKRGELAGPAADEALRKSVAASAAIHNRPFALRAALALHDLGRGPAAVELLARQLECYPETDNTAEFRRAQAIVSQATPE